MAGRKKSKTAKWFCVLITTLFHLLMGAAYWFLGFNLWDGFAWALQNKITIFISLSAVSFLLIIIFRLAFGGSNWFIGLGFAVSGFRFLVEFFMWESESLANKEDYIGVIIFTALYVVLMYLLSLGALKNDDDFRDSDVHVSKPIHQQIYEEFGYFGN